MDSLDVLLVDYLEYCLRSLRMEGESLAEVLDREAPDAVERYGAELWHRPVTVAEGARVFAAALAAVRIVGDQA